MRYWEKLGHNPSKSSTNKDHVIPAACGFKQNIAGNWNNIYFINTTCINGDWSLIVQCI